MSLLTYIHTQVYTFVEYIHKSIQRHVHLCMHKYVCTYHINTHIHMCINMRICKQTYALTHIYIWKIYTYLQMYTHIHTYIHTCIQKHINMQRTQYLFKLTNIHISMDTYIHISIKKFRSHIRNIYIHVHIKAYVHIYIHIKIYTYKYM